MAEKQEDLALSAGKNADWWVKEIKKSVKDWDKPRDRGQEVVKRYRDERDAAEKDTKRFNIFFSNVETLKPAVYSQVPVADIRRRYQDRDPVGRLAATVLQRATSYCLESYDFHSVLKRVRDDYLLPGFAIARAVYKPYLKKEGEAERVVFQEVRTEYIPWDMFAMSRSKVYERVWWAATAEDLSRDEVKAQFGNAVAEKLNFALKAEAEDDAVEGKVRVWEVWCKRGRSRFVVAEGSQEWVKAPEADPLRLENFYPWPKPLWAVGTNDTLKPTPEFLQYQDQAAELDDLTERIDVLTSALRRRGIYDGAHKDLFEMLTGTSDNNFVPVEDFIAILQKGGLEKVALEMPLEGLVAAIVQLEERREKVKQTIYEVTGIADIVRGASNASETATAQQIKGRWAGLRISSRQADFAVFARDLVRLKAEIIAERFDPQTLSMVSGIDLPYDAQKKQWQALQQAQQQAMAQYQQVAQQVQQAGQQPPPPPQIQQPKPEEQKFYSQPTWEEVLKVLRDDKLRGFKIDIETDSTVQPDADTEKTARTELLTAMGQAGQQLAAAVQAGLITQDVAREMFSFALRAYKAGSKLDEALDAMGTTQSGMTPQQAQAQQQQMQEQQQAMQKYAAELAKREKAAEQAEHQAALRAKDIQNAADKLKAERDLFDLEQATKKEIEAIRQGHAQEIDALGGSAESTLREIISALPPPQAAPAEGAEPAAKASRGSSGIRDIHIHTGGDKASTTDGSKPKKPRRLRIADQPDGSMMAEEVLDELTDAAPAAGAM